MSATTMDDGPAPPEYRLRSADTTAVAEVTRAVRAAAGSGPDDPAWIAAARQAWDELPVSVRRALREFRRSSGTHGVLLLRNLPVEPHALPATPTDRESVERQPTVPAALLTLIACGLGDPVAFRAEKGGALVQNVVPVPGMEAFQGNAGSDELAYHVENAFHPYRPDFILLLCLRPDHERVAGLRTACIRQVHHHLRDESVQALRRPEFVTKPPPSFGAGGEGTTPHPVLAGAPEDPDLRVDMTTTAALTSRAERALAEFAELLGRAATEVRMAEGDLAVVDNRVTVHGRSAFTPRYDGADRWLQRTFVLADLRRSRQDRRHDGYVIEQGG